MVDTVLKSLTALSKETPQTIELGSYRIVERFDVALASVATRRGREKDVLKAAKAVKLALPEPSQSSSSSIYGAFWLSTQQWMIEAPFDTHEDIGPHLKTIFSDAASITEQTDAWVRFDISASSLLPLFEKLSNIDLASAGTGFASRTVIEHIGCYLIKRGDTEVTLYGPRSMAHSLLHAIEMTAKSVV